MANKSLMKYLAAMFRKEWSKIVSGAILFSLVFLACQKKGDFIDESTIGSGVNYYPSILNNTFIDTLSGLNLEAENNTFSRGQKIVFALTYFSKDSLAGVELWSGEQRKNKKGRELSNPEKVDEIPYSSSFFSEETNSNETFVSYQIPGDLDSTVISLQLTPKVVTLKGLDDSHPLSLNIK